MENKKEPVVAPEFLTDEEREYRQYKNGSSTRLKIAAQILQASIISGEKMTSDEAVDAAEDLEFIVNAREASRRRLARPRGVIESTEEVKPVFFKKV